MAAAPVSPAAGDAPRPVSVGMGREDLPSVQFRAFYEELLRARQAALACTEADAAATARTLSRQLLQVIELHTLEMRRQGGRSVMDTEVQARFLKAALADEVMLNLEWSGRTAWRHVLLETQLFRSSVAGEKVFDDIEQLLRVREPSQRAPARLYLHALSLGFQGRWRGGRDLHRLGQYRRELFQFIAQREPILGEGDRMLSAQAYASTLSHLGRRRIPRLSRWGLGVALLLLMLLGLSELLWLWRSWPLREALNAVVAVLPWGVSGGRPLC